MPEWYTRGLLPTPGSPENRFATAEPPPAAPTMQFNVLEGDPKVLDDCPDTVAFLALLADLDRAPSPGDAAPAVLPEQRAARGLFRFDVRPPSPAPHHAHLSKLPTLSDLLSSFTVFSCLHELPKQCLRHDQSAAKCTDWLALVMVPLASPLSP